MGKGIRIYHENCDPELIKDSKLPTNAFAIKYKLDGNICYDISIAMKAVDVFDHYWDNYRNDLLDIKLADGKANPKLWNPSSSGGKKDE